MTATDFTGSVSGWAELIEAIDPRRLNGWQLGRHRDREAAGARGLAWSHAELITTLLL